MIGTKLTQEFEKLFSKEEYGIGRQGIILFVDYGRITIEEYDPIIDPREMNNLIDTIEDLKFKIRELESENRSLENQVEELEEELEQYD